MESSFLNYLYHRSEPDDEKELSYDEKSFEYYYKYEDRGKVEYDDQYEDSSPLYWSLPPQFLGNKVNFKTI